MLKNEKKVNKIYNKLLLENQFIQNTSSIIIISEYHYIRFYLRKTFMHQSIKVSAFIIHNPFNSLLDELKKGLIGSTEWLVKKLI
jgi:hypothetical protein